MSRGRQKSLAAGWFNRYNQYVVLNAYEGGIFMRGYLSCDIWQYDAVTDTFTCVIKQGEE